jgi:hypothetical protein
MIAMYAVDPNAALEMQLVTSKYAEENPGCWPILKTNWQYPPNSAMVKISTICAHFCFWFDFDSNELQKLRAFSTLSFLFVFEGKSDGIAAATKLTPIFCQSHRSVGLLFLLVCLCKVKLFSYPFYLHIVG